MAATATWPFAGRDDELTEITGRLRRRRGVLLSGPPGVGKTRLATEALAAVTGSHATTVALVASRPAAALPFGALAPLLEVDIESGGLSAARAAVRERTAAGPLLIHVDDLQWLDDASAVLLHQLVAAHEVTLLATMRSGSDDSAPEPALALWKDGHLDRLDIAPLDLVSTQDLLEAATSTQVDPATTARVFERTHGNALFVRELVDEAYRRGL